MQQERGRPARSGSEGRSRRPPIGVMVVLSVLLVVTLYVLRAKRSVSHGVATPESPALSHPAPAESPALSELSRSARGQPAVLAPAPGAPAVPTVFGEDLSQGLDLPPPPLPSGPPPPRPPRPEFSESEKIELREQGLALLDETVIRLEKEAQEQEQAGNTDGAHLTRIRLERLKAVRIQRRAELDEMNQHGAEPPESP